MPSIWSKFYKRAQHLSSGVCKAVACTVYKRQALNNTSAYTILFTSFAKPMSGWILWDPSMRCWLRYSLSEWEKASNNSTWNHQFTWLVVNITSGCGILLVTSPWTKHLEPVFYWAFRLLAQWFYSNVIPNEHPPGLRVGLPLCVGHRGCDWGIRGMTYIMYRAERKHRKPLVYYYLSRTCKLLLCGSVWLYTALTRHHYQTSRASGFW